MKINLIGHDISQTSATFISARKSWNLLCHFHGKIEFCDIHFITELHLDSSAKSFLVSIFEIRSAVNEYVQRWIAIVSTAATPPPPNQSLSRPRRVLVKS